MASPSSPGPVPKEALDYFKSKGIKPSFNYREVWKEEHNLAYTIAKVAEEDVLKDMREATLLAIENGVPFKEFQQSVRGILDRSGWSAYVSDNAKLYRLELIYETNMRVARAAGQWQRIERTKRSLPYLVYELGPSVRHRPEHVLWEGVILPVDDPFWNDHMPPNGFGCKCGVRQIGRAEAERLGGVSDRPSMKKVPWKNKETGEVEMVPIGIQPGWDYNPGKDRDHGIAA